MAVRRYAHQTNFAAGEVSEQFWQRFDTELFGKAARSMSNMLVTQNASAKTRPGTTRRSEWITSLFNVAVTPAVNFRVFRYSTMIDAGSAVTLLTKAKEYGMILRREDGTHVRIVKFDPTAATLADALKNTGQILADEAGELNSDGVTIAADQVLSSMFFVSNLWHPHRFIEAAVPDNDSGTVESVQFYKDVPGFIEVRTSATFAYVTFTSGDATDPAATLKAAGKPEDHFEIGGAIVHGKFIRISGKEYEIIQFLDDNPFEPAGNLRHDTIIIANTAHPGASVGSFWDGPDVAGLVAQRRWPNKFTAHSGLDIDDGMGFGDDNAGTYLSRFRPTCVAFHSGRLWLAASSPIGGGAAGGGFPYRVWASRAGDTFTISPAISYFGGIVPPDAPIEVDVLIDDGDRMLWAQSADRLYFGGIKATYIMVSGTGSVEVDGSKLIGLQKINSIGSQPAVPPISRNGQPIYVTRDAAAIVGSRFDFASQNFNTDDAGRFARHLTSGIRRLALRPPNQEDSIERLYVAKSAGAIAQAAYTDLFEYPAWAPVSMPSGLAVDDLVTIDGRTYLFVRATFGVTQKHSILRLDDDETANIALDFLNVATQVDPTIDSYADLITWNTAEEFLWSKVCYMWATQGSGYVAVGRVSVGASGNFAIDQFTDPITAEHFFYYDIYHATYNATGQDAPVTGVKVGLPVSSSMVPMPGFGDDERGRSVNRRSRLISTTVNVRATRSFAIDAQPMMPTPTPVTGTTPNFKLQEKIERTGVYKRLHWGHDPDPTVTITNDAPHRAEILNLTQEVAT